MMLMSKYKIIGQGIPRIDTPAKATGEALFTADIKLPRMLVGKVLHSPYAHAIIKNIDTRVTFKFYFSRSIQGISPAIKDYAQRVENFLREYQAYNEKIKLESDLSDLKIELSSLNTEYKTLKLNNETFLV